MNTVQLVRLAYKVLFKVAQILPSYQPKLPISSAQFSLGSSSYSHSLCSAAKTKVCL